MAIAAKASVRGRFKRKGLRPFAQITVDSDFGSGPDSIQSYFGVDLDLRQLFGGESAPAAKR